MPNLEDELIAKLKRGEAIPDVRKWFLTELARLGPSFDDLTPFEQSFLNQTIYAFEAWRREQLN